VVSQVKPSQSGVRLRPADREPAGGVDQYFERGLAQVLRELPEAGTGKPASSLLSMADQ